MITILGITGLVLLIFLKESTLFATEISTYQTKIIDKKKDMAIIPIPIVIPVPKYYIFTEEGRKLDVRQVVFNRISIGDLVSVTQYSNGIHKLT
jgi:hypothetical protein